MHRPDNDNFVDFQSQSIICGLDNSNCSSQYSQNSLLITYLPINKQLPSEHTSSVINKQLSSEHTFSTINKQPFSEHRNFHSKKPHAQAISRPSTSSYIIRPGQSPDFPILLIHDHREINPTQKNTISQNQVETPIQNQVENLSQNQIETASQNEVGAESLTIDLKLTQVQIALMLKQMTKNIPQDPNNPKDNPNNPNPQHIFKLTQTKFAPLKQFSLYDQQLTLPPTLTFADQIDPIHASNLSQSTKTPTDRSLFLYTLLCQYFAIKQPQNSPFKQPPNFFVKTLQIFKPLIPEQVLHAQKIFQIVALWNKMVLSNTKFSIHQFARLLGISPHLSLKQTKIQVFVKAYLYPKFGTRIFRHSLSVQNIESITDKIIFHPTIETFYLESLSQKQIQNKVNYFVHKAQFFNQILSEYSSSNNMTLSSSFNCARFLLMNLMSFFALQSFVYIEKLIGRKYGSLYFHILKQRRNNNKRWKDSIQKIFDCVKISSQKINQYIEQSQSKDKVQANVNVKKIKMMLDPKNSNLKKIYRELNPLQNQQKAIKKYLENFFPQMAKNTYAESIKIMVQECCNKTVLERTLKNKLLKKEEYKSLVDKVNIEIDSFDKDKIEQIRPKGLPAKRAWKKLLEEYTMIYIQNLKCFSLVMSFAFYSFQNEHQNQRRKQYLDEIGRNNQPAANLLSERFFLNIDKLYIYKRMRINYEFLLKSRQLVIDQVARDYLKITKELLEFIEEDDLVTKENYLKQKLFNPPNVLSTEKPLHENRMAVLDLDDKNQDACLKILYIPHQYIKRPSASYSDVQRVWTQKWEIERKKMQSQEAQINRKKSVESQADSYLGQIRNFRNNLDTICKVYGRLKEQIAVEQAEQVQYRLHNRNNFSKSKKRGSSGQSARITEGQSIKSQSFGYKPIPVIPKEIKVDKEEKKDQPKVKNSHVKVKNQQSEPLKQVRKR